jgi:hypothetical protein
MNFMKRQSSCVAVLLVFLMILNSISSHAQNVQANGESYDITAKVDGVHFKEGVTSIQELSNAMSLAVETRSGKSVFIVVKGGKNYCQKTNSVSGYSPVAIKVGFCTITVYRDKQPDKVNIGNPTLVSVRCN